METGLIRLERRLLRKDWSDQPRAPGGQPDGGRWVPAGGGGGTAPTDPEATTAADGNRLLKLLLARHPDLGLSRRCVWIKPVGHFVRRIAIRPTSSADWLMPDWDIREVYRPCWGGLDGYGRNHSGLARPGTGWNWNWNEPDLAEALFTVIEDEILPWLRMIDTFETYVAFARADPVEGDSMGLEWEMLARIGMGELDAARAIWGVIGPHYDPGGLPREPWWRYRDERLIQLGPPLRTGDRASLARLLHTWEAEMIAGAPMRADWRPTPFPLERGLDTARAQALRRQDGFPVATVSPHLAAPARGNVGAQP